MTESEEIVRDFLVESYESMDLLEQKLVELEQRPHDVEILKAIFRTVHTIKGTCGFLAFARLEELTHVGENLLSLLRDGVLVVGAEIATALLCLTDAIRKMLNAIEATGSDLAGDHSALAATLARLATKPAPKSAAELVPSSEPAPVPIPRIGDLLLASGLVNQAQLDAALAKQKAGDTRQLGEVLVAQGVIKAEVVAETLKVQAEARAASQLSNNSVRVDVELLDKLMNLVGELVLARNQILQYASTQKDASFLSTTQRLNLITTELQEGVMKTRMQPIGNVRSQLPRVVRDLARSCGKKVRIEMHGKETELDKTIIEAIKDPLTHLVRNCVDHGIESPEKRVAAEKPEEGRLSLRAYHEGGQVNIEISDDGGGICVQRIRDKALGLGLIGADEALRMSERELMNLVFLPGFSTAETVTNVSGRGVGMDVVKTNIDKIGGTIDLQSRVGSGTTLRIRIPLTLAIIPALVVRGGGDRYAIPQVSLLELVRLDGARAGALVEHVHGAPVYRLRERLLPLVYLDEALGLREDRASRLEHEAVNIVVLRADDDQSFGLVVDAVLDTEEIVVKPLGKQLRGMTSFAGATIMGDGQVALILDVAGIAQRARVVLDAKERVQRRPETEVVAQSEKKALLLLGVGLSSRIAIPLSMVARLEEFPAAALERSGAQDVVQYRGQILPLVRLSDVLPVHQRARSDDELLQVVVYSEEGRHVGLIVDSIVDIVEESLSMERDVAQGGLLGSAVIGQRVTDLLDVRGIIRSVDPGFFDRPLAA